MLILLLILSKLRSFSSIHHMNMTTLIASFDGIKQSFFKHPAVVLYHPCFLSDVLLVLNTTQSSLWLWLRAERTTWTHLLAANDMALRLLQFLWLFLKELLSSRQGNSRT